MSLRCALCFSFGLALPLSLSCSAQTAPLGGALAPANWKASDDFKTGITLSPDAATASIRLEAQTSRGAKMVSSVDVGAGSTLVSGVTKTEGGVTALKLDLQVFDAGWKQLAWITSDDNDANKLKPSAGLQAFSRSIELPANTAHVVVYFSLSGQGTATLQNFRLAPPPRADFSPEADAKSIGDTAPVRVVKATPYRWKNAIIGGVEYCTNILFNPKHPELMYSRNDTGSIYRFDRKGKRWVSLMDNLPYSWTNLFVADSMALDANNPNTLYVQAGASQWSTPFDVLKTTDGGQTWTRTFLKNRDGKDVYVNAGGNEKPAAERLAVDPNDSNVLFCGTRRDGLFISRDAAKTWQSVANFPAVGGDDTGLSFVTFDWRGTRKGPTQTIYIGVHAGKKADGGVAQGAVYRSQDGGKSWTKLDGGFDPQSSPIRGRVGLDGTLYVSTSGGAGLWKFANERWSNITPPDGKGQSFSGIGIHPTDPKQILAITYNEKVPIFYSKDGGATWTNYAYKDGGGGNLDIGFMPAWVMNDAHFKWPTGYCSTIDFDPTNPSVAVEADFSGANIITGIGKPRARVDMLSEGREQMTMADALSPSKGAPLVSGAWDLGGYRHTSLDEIPKQRLQVRQADGSAFTGWNDYMNGFQDGFQLDANPNNPDAIVAAGGWQWNNTGTGAISRDNGQTFRVFASKPFADAKFGRIAVGTNPDNIVWAPMGTKDTPVYSSKDGGKSWAEGEGCPRGTVATDGPWSFYKMLAADRVLDGHFLLYDHRDGRVYRSTDGGATWKHVSTLPKQLGAHFDTNKLQFAPNTPNLVWAALQEQGLFESVDGGLTWKKVPNVPWARVFAWGKGTLPQKPTVFLFGQIGGKSPASVEDVDARLYRSDDLGATWTQINDKTMGFPGSGAIEGDKQVSARVYVVTGGRGVFYGVPK